MRKVRQQLSALVYTFALFIAPGNASAANWTRVGDGTILVYTPQPTEQANSLLKRLSDLRMVMAQTKLFQVNDGFHLNVIVFNSETEFNHYRLNAASCAFFAQTRRGEYVVLQDLAPGHVEVSAHEFTHFLLAHADVTLPLWMNEGLADFYSSYQISDGRIILGESVTGRLSILRNYSWLPLENLFQISTTSNYYSDPARMALFYSESWALVHMLVISPEYGPHFREFVDALNSGRSSAESLRLVYNKSQEQIFADLRSYVDRQHLPVLDVALNASHTATAQSAATVSEAEMEVMLADLLSNNSQNDPAVKSRLAAASSQLPDNAAAEESLAFIALRQGNMSEARTHLQLAADRHSNDANIYFYLAHLKREADAPSQEVMPLLEQALALKPDLGDALLELALQAVADGNYARALDALHKLTVPRPQNAFAAAYTEAYCYAHIEQFDQARKTVQRASSIANNERDRTQASELLDFITQEEQDAKP